MIRHQQNRQTGSGDDLTHRDVTLSMPILRSSSVQAVRTVFTSMLPLASILPEVFSKCRANSPSLRSCWCWRSEGCRDKSQAQEPELTPNTGPRQNSAFFFFMLVLTDLFGIEVQNQTKRLNVEVKLHSLQIFIILFTAAHTHLCSIT